jgi:hypothetical protein
MAAGGTGDLNEHDPALQIAPRLILEIDIGERLPVVIADDIAGGLFLDGSGAVKERRASSRASGFCALLNIWRLS